MYQIPWTSQGKCLLESIQSRAFKSDGQLYLGLQVLLNVLHENHINVEVISYFQQNNLSIVLTTNIQSSLIKMATMQSVYNLIEAFGHLLYTMVQL